MVIINTDLFLFFSPTCVTSKDTFFHAFFRNVYFSQAVKETFLILQNLFLYVSQIPYIIKLVFCLREKKGQPDFIFLYLYFCRTFCFLMSVVLFIPIF